MKEKKDLDKIVVPWLHQSRLEGEIHSLQVMVELCCMRSKRATPAMMKAGGYDKWVDKIVAATYRILEKELRVEMKKKLKRFRRNRAKLP